MLDEAARLKASIEAKKAMLSSGEDGSKGAKPLTINTGDPRRNDPARASNENPIIEVADNKGADEEAYSYDYYEEYDEEVVEEEEAE